MLSRTSSLIIRSSRFSPSLFSSSLLSSSTQFSPSLSSSFLRVTKRWNSTEQNTITEERPLFIVTDRCAERINEIKEEDKNENIKLRVAVDSGGCSGYKYSLDLEETVEPEDLIYERNGAQVIVDKESIKYLVGSRIDFTNELIGSKFKILDNPQSEKSCGCGTSFNLKQGS